MMRSTLMRSTSLPEPRFDVNSSRAASMASALPLEGVARSASSFTMNHSQNAVFSMNMACLVVGRGGALFQERVKRLWTEPVEVCGDKSVHGVLDGNCQHCTDQRSIGARVASQHKNDAKFLHRLAIASRFQGIVGPHLDGLNGLPNLDQVRHQGGWSIGEVNAPIARSLHLDRPP